MEKKKIIACFILLFSGLLVYLSGVLYRECAPYENEFSDLIKFAFFWCFTIAAVVILAINCIACIVFLIQKIQYAKICVLVFLCSLIFMLYLIGSLLR